MQNFDVAIVGLGALGSGAAYHAARKGATVIAFEQFELGHVRGASHDTSRIVRTSYGEPQYVALAKSAYKDWANLEAEAGVKLLTITGGVVFLDEGSVKFSTKSFTSSLEANGVSYELLSASEVNARWPQFNLPDGMNTVYTADTGIAHASKSVAAMQRLAISHGALLKEHTRVDRVTPNPSGAGVSIETSNGKFSASKVILTTDAWTNHLLKPLRAEIPLTVMQEQVTYFKPTNPSAFEASVFPVWIWGHQLSFYGFPCYGESTIKAARDTSNNFMNPDQRTFIHSPELETQLKEFMNATIPDKGRRVLRTVTCQYTITPDRQFIISPLENYSDIILGLGAAHAFKFAPAIGRILAELAIDGKTTDDVSKFGIPKQEKLTSQL